MAHPRLVTVLLCLAAACALASAAPSRFRARAWSTVDGLPQNSVTAVRQTRDGYLWCATLDGLVRFDGVRFVVFDRSGARGIRSNRFVDLCEDGDGALWACTEDAGVVRYRDGAFEPFGAAEGLPDDDAFGAVVDRDGALFVTTRTGVARFDGRRFATVATRDEDERPYVGPSGTLWRVGAGFVAATRGDVTRTSPLPPDVTAPSVVRAYETRDGSLWFGSVGDLYRVAVDGVTRFGAAGPTAGAIRAIFEDRDGVVWVGAEDGLRVVRGGALEPVAAAGLGAVDVRAIAQDREGTIWVGTGQRGLVRLTRTPIEFLSSSDGLTGTGVYPIYEDRSGAVWVGSKGLAKLVDGRTTRYGRADGLRHDLVMSLCEDRDGRLWVGCVAGVYWFRDGVFHDFGARLGLPPDNYNVWAIAEDSGGAIWFGTDLGLFRYADDELRRFTTADGLAGDDVKAITEDSRGALWVATYGGLSAYRDGRFRTYRESDGLASDRVRCVHEDERGAVWVGTYDGGLSRVTGDRVATIRAADGLFSNGVFQILDDGRGDFWMSSNRGLYRARKADLDAFADGAARSVSCVSYGRDDGLESVECNGGRQPAGVRARDGRLWFPTQGGVAVVDPAAAAPNEVPPPVAIESASVDRAPVRLGAAVRVGPNDRGLELAYTAMSFVRPEQVAFRYRLEGYDRDWVDAGTRRTAYYGELPPGEYEFVVTAANGDGVWNEVGARVPVVVVPPFWRTWWFFALATLAVGGAAAALYRRRVAQLERAHAAQQAISRRLIESQERERKRIAAELHDSLGQRLVVIKNLALLALHRSGDGEELRRRVDELSSETSAAIDEVKEISYNLRPYQLDRLGLTRAIESVVEAVSGASEIRFSWEIDDVDGCFSKEDEIGVYRIVQESVSNVAKHSGAAEARVEVAREPGRVRIVVRDDGRGFVPNAAPAAAPGRGGFGLVGIGERARMLGGRFVVDSAPGRGTTLRVDIDVRSGSDER